MVGRRKPSRDPAVQLAHLLQQQARIFRSKPTRSEQILWDALNGRKLQGYKFRRQHPIPPFIVDFLCHDAHLIVEIDGPIHDTQQDHDRARQSYLEQKGYGVLRIAAHEVEHDLPSVLQRIVTALSSA